MRAARGWRPARKTRKGQGRAKFENLPVAIVTNEAYYSSPACMVGLESSLIFYGASWFTAALVCDARALPAGWRCTLALLNVTSLGACSVGGSGCVRRSLGDEVLDADLYLPQQLHCPRNHCY